VFVIFFAAHTSGIFGIVYVKMNGLLAVLNNVFIPVNVPELCNILHALSVLMKSV
jgi:hypothetical protein